MYSFKVPALSPDGTVVQNMFCGAVLSSQKGRSMPSRVGFELTTFLQECSGRSANHSCIPWSCALPSIFFSLKFLFKQQQWPCLTSCFLFPAEEGEYFLKVLIPSYAAGSIIGKGGQTIVQLQKETGATIKLSKSKDFYPGKTLVTLSLRFMCSLHRPGLHRQRGNCICLNS